MKTGLVLEGGGMKCAYGAGVLDRFLDDHVTFDYVNGASAGIANGASFIAGQKGRNLRFYVYHNHDPRYFGLKSFEKTGDLFGLDYIYTTLTNSTGQDPLYWTCALRNPAEFEMATTNAITGQAHFFGKDEMPKDNYEILKASCAMPGACRPRFINGVPYFDGGLAAPIPYERAFEKGCRRVVVILSEPRNSVKKPQKLRLLYHRILRHYPKIVKMIDERHHTYMDIFHKVLHLEKEGKLFVFAPHQKEAVSTENMDDRVAYSMYQMGVHDYNERKEKLRAYLAGA